VSEPTLAFQRTLQGKAKEADKVSKVSYVRDNLLSEFTTSILVAEAEGAFVQEPQPAEAEKGLRSMAPVPAWDRGVSLDGS
jgi:hypothetical protein